MIILPILLLALLIGYLLLSHYGKSQLYIFNVPESPQARSIDVLYALKLGETSQWLSIRGNDVDNPLLVYLHDGPGAANLAFLRQQVPELEKYFVVVTWDQPGAGKSSGFRFDHKTLSIERVLRDAHQLILHLKKQFPGNRVFLLGFDWGSLLSFKLAQRYPTEISGIFNVGQVVNYSEAEAISLEYTRKIARDHSNSSALKQMEAIDPTYNSDDWFKQLKIQRKWLARFGGVSRTHSRYSYESVMVARASEYSYLDFAHWSRSGSRSMKALWPELMQVNLERSVPALEVPVVIFAGRYDYKTPSVLVDRYFNNLQVPQGKELVMFDNSSHVIFFDEPLKLVEEITSRVH